jgi:hypothetical protein
VAETNSKRQECLQRRGRLAVLVYSVPQEDGRGEISERRGVGADVHACRLIDGLLDCGPSSDRSVRLAAAKT